MNIAVSTSTHSIPVAVSARAAKRIEQVLAMEPNGSMLRVAVNGGGCSGFQYAFEVTLEKNDDDLILKRDADPPGVPDRTTKCQGLLECSGGIVKVASQPQRRAQ